MGLQTKSRSIPNLGCVDPILGVSSESMNESIHSYVVRHLQDSKGTWPRIAKETGISKRTIEKIARQEVKDPGVSLVERLQRYFQEKAA